MSELTTDDIRTFGDVIPSDAAARVEWCAAFVKAQSQLINPPKTERAKVKTKTGTDYSYGYASLPDIIDSVRVVLFDNGLAFTQGIESDGLGAVGVTTTIYHAAGHSETFGPVAMPAGTTPQEYGSAITYARRYALCAVLGIAADEDDDGAKASKRASSERTSSARSGGKAGADSDGEAGTAPAPTSSAGEARAGVEGDKPRSLPAEDPNPATEASAGDSTSVPPEVGSDGSASGSKPTCSVNGAFHFPDPELSMKAREGFVVCACGEGMPQKRLASTSAWLEAVPV